MLTGCAAISSILITRNIRNQLEEISPTSYSEIMDWVNYQLPRFADRLDELNFTVYARGTDGNFLARGFIYDEFRFVEWNYSFNEHDLEIDIIYLTFEELIEKRLSEIDRTSLMEIEEWIEENEKGIEIRTTVVDTDGNIMHHFDIENGRDFFVEWDFSIDKAFGVYVIRFEYILELVQTVSLGETFVIAGMQFTFEDNISGGIIDVYRSREDGQAYINVPVRVENISDETINSFHFNIDAFGPDGEELNRFVASLADSITLTGNLHPGGTNEAYVSVRYEGDGDYVLEVSAWSFLRTPFTIRVLVPVYDIYIPAMEDRYNREVPIPPVVFDLNEITLFSHNLSRDSFFYSVPYESALGNTYMILEPNDIVRDPDGVITHDSLRIGYNFFEFESGEILDAIELMESAAEMLQQGGNPSTIIGPIRATEDRMTTLLQTRRGVGGDLHTRLWIIQVFPENNEYVIFQTWLWTLRETSLEGERRAAIEEFGRITGIDFIGILRDTFED